MITQKKLGQKIKKLREQMGWSQEIFASKLNLPRPAISQIESGQRKVDSLELKKIAELFSVSIDELLLDTTRTKREKKKRKRFTMPKLDKEKFKQVLLYILEKCGAKPNVGETVLYKLLYFCDFDFYELYEKPLTGMKYRKINYGPAPCDFDELVEEMIKNDELKRISTEYYGNPQKKYIPLINADLKEIGVEGKEVIDKVINKLSDMDATRIAEYSHQDIPCDTTPDKEVIDYELVFYRKPAYSVRNYQEE